MPACVLDYFSVSLHLFFLLLQCEGINSEPHVRQLLSFEVSLPALLLLFLFWDRVLPSLALNSWSSSLSLLSSWDYKHEPPYLASIISLFNGVFCHPEILHFYVVKSFMASWCLETLTHLKDYKTTAPIFLIEIKCSSSLLHLVPSKPPWLWNCNYLGANREEACVTMHLSGGRKLPGSSEKKEFNLQTFDLHQKIDGSE